MIFFFPQLENEVAYHLTRYKFRNPHQSELAVHVFVIQKSFDIIRESFDIMDDPKIPTYEWASRKVSTSSNNC